MKATAKRVQSTAQLRKPTKVSFSRCGCKGKRFGTLPCVCQLDNTKRQQDTTFYKEEMDVIGLVSGVEYDKYANCMTPEEYEKREQLKSEKKKMELHAREMFKLYGKRSLKQQQQQPK